MGLRRKIVIVSKPVEEGSACHFSFPAIVSYHSLHFLLFLGQELWCCKWIASSPGPNCNERYVKRQHAE